MDSTATTPPATTMLPPSPPPSPAPGDRLRTGRAVVAVIGSGLAGLSVGHLLAKSKLKKEESLGEDEEETDGDAFEVHLFERSPSLGMDAASIPVPCDCADCVGTERATTARHVEARMDVPMRSFFPEYYPILTGIYESIGITYEASDNSMSFVNYDKVCETPAQAFNLPQSFPTRLSSPHTITSNAPKPPSKTYFSFSCYHIPPPISNIISFPDFLPIVSLLSSPVSFVARVFRNVGVVRNYVRLLVHSKRLLWSGELALARIGRGGLKGVTLGKWFKENGYGEFFVRDAFFPLFSGVCTCSFETLSNFPAAIVLEYVATCMPFGKMSFVSNGIDKVCTGLSSPFRKNIHLSSSISHITRNPLTKKYTLHVSSPTSPSSPSPFPREFDHVVFATQANQCAAILDRSKGIATGAVGVLKKFPYERSLVVCHTDHTVMPADKAHWRCLNFGRLDPSIPSSPLKNTSLGYDPSTVSMCTHYDMTTRQTNNIFQTTNPVVLPDSEKILSAAWFERCVVTLDSIQAVGELDAHQGVESVWFVGSFASHGIPLLEGCVTSAARVLKGISETVGREGWHVLPYAPWKGGLEADGVCVDGGAGKVGERGVGLKGVVGVAGVAGVVVMVLGGFVVGFLVVGGFVDLEIGWTMAVLVLVAGALEVV
ncbi:hypothetical protein HDU67_004906 [Dinochytrium kinnereticum]|nr:hypothetical protein HDU67_004906 [Dinochytrium kinnereticum]